MRVLHRQNQTCLRLSAPIGRSMSPRTVVHRFLERTAFDWTIGIYASFGLAPHSGCFVAWTRVQAIILVVYIGALLAYGPDIAAQYDSFGQLNALFKGSTMMLTHLAILLESLYSRQSLQALLALLASIDVRLHREFDSSVEPIRRSRRMFVLTFIAFVAFVWAAEALIRRVVSRSLEWRRYWLATVWSLSVGRLRHLQQAMLVRALAVRVRSVRRAMHDEETQPVAGRLVRLQRLAADVHEVVERMQRVFGLGQLLNLTHNFVQLSCDLYWMYTTLMRGERANELIGILAMSAVAVICRII